MVTEKNHKEETHSDSGVRKKKRQIKDAEITAVTSHTCVFGAP